MVNLDPELEKILESSFQLRQALEQVLPKNAVDYIAILIAKDNAHRKFLKRTEEPDIGV